jgi:hypothetical protein
MMELLEKLNYKGQQRIAVINAEVNFASTLTGNMAEILIDREIDPRYPYSFIIIFVKSVADIELHTPGAIHNLLADGVLWFCYPKKSSKKYSCDIDRDHGWETLNNAGLHGIRMVSVDENWSALRFRNAKFIKSTNKRFTH